VVKKRKEKKLQIISEKKEEDRTDIKRKFNYLSGRLATANLFWYQEYIWQKAKFSMVGRGDPLK